MNKDLYIGIDTSNYTTSLALCDGEGTVLANLKAPLPVKEGERGLRQSDAVFAHVKNLPPLMAELKLVLREPEIGEESIRGIGFSATPRRSADSYMPCFLAGKTAATSFAAALGVPLYAFSHQNGHIMAAAYASGQMEKLMQGQFTAGAVKRLLG